MRAFSASPIARHAGSAITSVGWTILAAVFLLLLSSLGRVDGVPTVVAVAIGLLAGVSALWPLRALLLTTAVVPVATWLGQTWHGGVAWPETVVVAFIAGYSARQIFPPHRQTFSESSIVAAALLVVGASLAVHLLFVGSTSGTMELRSTLWRLMTREYFIDTGQLQVDAAMRLIEGLLLLRAAWGSAATEPSFAFRATRAFVLGAAAAAMVNVIYLWDAAMRRDSPLRTFLTYAATIRFNRQYGDVNAAGSYFVMSFFPAVAMAMRRWNMAALLASVLIASSMAFSGSRTALAAGFVSAVVLAAASFRGRPIKHLLNPRVLSALGVVALIVSAGIYGALMRNPTRVFDAIHLRVGFTRAGLGMLATDPMFGVGVGEFWLQSAEFMPALRPLYYATRENAHNNFLQWLAELGIVGFAAMVGTLAVAAIACARRLAQSPRDWTQWSVNAGLLAFVFTWFTGHPMLIDGPAFSFWILLGVAAGWGATPLRMRMPVPLRLGIGIAAVIAVIAIPVRVRTEVGRANLEHQGINVSAWHHGEDGVRYRLAGVESTVFLPSEARAVTLPLRATNENEELVVELRLQGRIADVVRVSGAQWFLLRLPLPHTGGGPMFTALTLRVREPTLAGAEPLKIGKATPL